MRLERGQAPFAQVGAGEDSEPLHLSRGDRPDAMEARDRQRGDELRALFRRDHAQAVGLAMVGGELGDELAIADAGRGGELALLADPPADVLGDGAGAAEAVPVFGHVEIGFVEAQRLDQVGIVAEDRADLLRLTAR